MTLPALVSETEWQTARDEPLVNGECPGGAR